MSSDGVGCEAELAIIYMVGADKVLRRKSAHHTPRALHKNLSADGIDVEGTLAGGLRAQYASADVAERDTTE